MCYVKKFSNQLKVSNKSRKIVNARAIILFRRRLRTFQATQVNILRSAYERSQLNSNSNMDLCVCCRAYTKIDVVELRGKNLSMLWLPDPRGAGHVEAFQFLSVRVSVCVSVCSLYLFGLVRLGLRDLGIVGLGYNDGWLMMDDGWWMMDDGWWMMDDGM